MRTPILTPNPPRFPSIARRLGALTLALTLVASPAVAQDGQDFGDAPEDVLAYPSTGQTGFFPTCLGGSAGFVRHGLGWAHFFSAAPPQLPWDVEPDGNAGICPPPPYDLDECFADGDAGLVTPTSYTIVNGQVQLCPTVTNPVSLGGSCTMATITFNVVNNMPVDGFINAVFDWDRNGMWAGQWPCSPTLFAPEHAVVNERIPVGFSGLWTSQPFLVGSPGNVLVWMRLEVAESPVGANWDGSGDFEDGESEDYLVRVDIPSVPVEQSTWGAIKTLYR